MSLSKTVLKDMIHREFQTYFGVKNEKYINSVVESRHNIEQWSWLWEDIQKEIAPGAKILDMAAGVGTFVLYGLIKGYDVWGIEPDTSKIAYYQYRVEELNLKDEYKYRILRSVGEDLPFRDATFDFVISWQTLEHVQDVKKCILEMLRVLKPKGKLRICLPCYGSSFFEPHYRVFMLPNIMRNKTIFKLYLKLLGRPTLGLDLINFVTEKEIISILTDENIEFTDLVKLRLRESKERAFKKYKILKLLGSPLVEWLIYLYWFFYLSKGEKQIDILAVKP